jgi:hypothetical protein
MRKRNLLVVVGGLLLACWMNIAIAADQGLILGFTIAREVRLVSVVASHSPTRDRPLAGPVWKLRATDSLGREIWVRSLVVPRQYDDAGTTELSFSVVVPRPQSGTRLSMRDADGIEIWRGSVDEAMLQVADEAAALVQKELAQAASKRASGDGSANASLALRTSQAKVQVGPLNSTTARKTPATAQDPDSLSLLRRITSSKVTGNPTSLAPGHQRMLRNRFNGGSVASVIEAPELQSSVPAKLMAEESWELDVRLLDSSGHPINAIPTGFAFSYDDPEHTNFPLDASPGRLRVRVPTRTDFSYQIVLADMPGYTPQIFLRVGTISGSTSLSFTLAPAAQARVRLTVEGGLSLPEGTRYLQCSSAAEDPEVRYFYGLDMGGNTEATLPLPYGVPLRCVVFIDESRLQVTFNDVVFHSATTQVLTLPKTSNVTIRLLEAGGNEFSGSFFIAWFGSSAISACIANPCHLLLPSELPVELNVQFNDGSYRNFSIGPEIFAPGEVRTITLKREFSVSGTVDIVGLPYDYTRVRAFDSANGDLVVSTIAEWPSGQFELPLAEGTYVFEAEQNNEYLYQDGAFYRSPWRSNPIHISGDTELPPLSAADDLGQLVLSAQVPCNGAGSYRSDFPARMVVVAADGTRIERVVSVDSSTSVEPCTSRYLARLSPGIYDIEFSPIGWPARSIRNVQVAAGATIERTESFAANTRTLVWTGTLRTATGDAVPGAAMSLFDEALDNRISRWTDSQGRFELPFEPGWMVRIETGEFQAGTAAVPQIVHLDRMPPSSSFQLDEIPMINELDGSLYRVYGDGQHENRINLVFVAEGYAGTSESFTDTNGNGLWDGVVWYDLDGNGAYTPSVDLYQVYGAAAYPREGEDPTTGNEPFTDNNADGFPNLDDHALFMENVHAFLKSLFGSDFWDRHRDAFNAYVLFEPSDQAGYSVVSSSGERLLTRNTRYGATLDQDRGLLRIDNQGILNRTLVAMPDADVAVAMINQPIFAGRASAASSLLIYNGGPATVSSGSLTPAHEMGHVVAQLCDEYAEFSGISPFRGQTAISCANASFTPNPSHIPWANWLASGSQIPSSDLDGSVGVYEGAMLYLGGAYRPSYRSIMRNLAPLFNAPSRAALETAIHARTGEWHDEADDSGRCARLPPNAVRRQGFTCH